MQTKFQFLIDYQIFFPALQCTVVHCSLVWYIVVHCSDVPRCSAISAVWCSFGLTYCSFVQHTWCGTLQYSPDNFVQYPVEQCNLLMQHTAHGIVWYAQCSSLGLVYCSFVFCSTVWHAWCSILQFFWSIVWYTIQ